MDNHQMPRTADIVIIGGGVHGASLAFHLARAKAGKVLLLEKNAIASGPTGQSGAMIRPLFTERTYVDLVLRSTRMFEQWEELVGGDAGFDQRGFLRITRSTETDDLGADLDLVREFNEPFEILDTHQLRKMLPPARFDGKEIGVLLPRGGSADPVKTTITLAQAAKRHGVAIAQGVCVKSITTKADRAHTLTTDAGSVETRHVVNCAGVWSRRLAEMVGIDLPIEVHRTPTCLFRTPETMPDDGPIISDGITRVYLRPMGDTILRAAHFGWAPDPADPDAFDRTINAEQLNLLNQSSADRIEAMRHTPTYGGFSALYDMTPDGHPILQHFNDTIEGFWCNCGWSGNGFASAPAAGQSLAQMIMSAPTDVDLSLFAWPRPAETVGRADMKWVYR